MKRFVMTAVLALVGCSRELPPDLVVQCEEDADCPGALVCVVELQTCLTPDAAAGRTCGDGIVARDGSEQCDDGALNADEPGACRTTCMQGICGDAIVDPGEQCDDGNDENEDPCLSTCEHNACGDGVAELAEASEECDDGNAILNDHCLPGCALNVCGDGVVDELDEACDDGNGVDGDACRNDCGLNVCGDGVVFTGVEVCDVGDTADGDGCRGDCRKVEACGDAVQDAGEECDDGNLNPADGCDACASVVWRRRVVAGSASAVAPALNVPLPGLGCLEGEGPTGLLVQDGCLVRRFDVVARTLELVAGASQCGFAGDGGPATAALLNNPAGMAVDASGRIYLADRGNHRVRRIELDGTINTVVGDGVAGFGGDGGPAAAARLSSPSDVSIDPAGRILIADTGNHRVRVIDLDGRARTLIGTGANGNSGDGGLATAAAIAAPEFVHARPSGGAFASAGSSSVRFVEATAGAPLVRAVSGLFHGTMCNPTGVGDELWVGTYSGHLAAFYDVFDTDGLLTTTLMPYGGGSDFHLGFIEGGGVITGRSHTLRDLDGEIIAGSATATRLIAGDVASAVAMGVSDLEPIGGGAFVIADEVAQRLVVVDNAGLVDRVQSIGEVLANGRVTGPSGLARDGDGALYIGDNKNRIWRLELAGDVVTLVEERLTMVVGMPNYWAGRVGGMAPVPSGGYVVTDLDLDTAGAFGIPSTGGDGCYPDIVVTNDSVAVFVDVCTDTVRAALAFDNAPYLAGTGTAGFNGDGVATASMLNNPSALATDGSAVFIADAGNGRLRRLDPDGTLTTLAGPGTPGPLQGRRLGDANFGNIVRMAYLDGDLLVATSTQVLRVDGSFDPDSRIEPLAGAFDEPGLGVGDATSLAGAASAVAIPDRGVLVAQSHRMALVELDTRVARPGIGIIDGFAPDADPLMPPGLVSARYAALGVRFSAIAGSGGSYLYADEGDHSLWQLDAGGEPEAWTVHKLAGLGPGLQDGPLAAARFDAPSGVALADDGSIFVADATHHVIRKIDATTDEVETIAGTPGIAGIYGDGGDAHEALFDTPRALALHPDGTLFIVDAGNGRVRALAPDGRISTVIGDGTASSTGEGAPASSFPLDDPRGLALDGFGNLFITAHDVVRVVLAPDAGPPSGDSQVITILGRAPRTEYPERTLRCLTAPAVIDDGRVAVADACNGLVLELTLEPAQP